MNGKRSILLGLALALAMTACGRDDTAPVVATPEPAAADEPAAAATPAGSPWDESQAPVTGTSITLSPSPADLCARATTAVDVSWDVAAASPSTIELWVRDGGQTQTLWAAVKDTAGSKRTGDWMKAGMQVVVVDPARKAVINTATVEAAPCP